MAGLTLAGLLAHLGSMGVAHRSALPSDGNTLWYLTRTMAIGSYVALTVSVMLGLLRTIARSSRERLTWVVDEVHAFVASLAGVLMVGHLVTLKFHTFIPFTIGNLLLPGDQPYRPFAVNLGVFALYTMSLTLLSSWPRRYLSYKVWRGIHYVSFVAFALVTAHGWLAGSDAGETWMRALYGGAAGGVAFLLLLRLTSRPKAAAVQQAA